MPRYLPPRSVRLRRILDQRQAMRSCHCVDRRHSGQTPVEVNGQNRFGARGQRRLKQRRIEIVRLRVNIHKNGPRPNLQDRRCLVDARIRYGDDLIAGANV